MSTTVYPVPGVFLPGYPTVPQEGLTKADAEALVATGAYQYDKPAEPEPEAVVASEPEE